MVIKKICFLLSLVLMMANISSALCEAPVEKPYIVDVAMAADGTTVAASQRTIYYIQLLDDKITYQAIASVDAEKQWKMAEGADEPIIVLYGGVVQELKANKWDTLFACPQEYAEWFVGHAVYNKNSVYFTLISPENEIELIAYDLQKDSLKFKAANFPNQWFYIEEGKIKTFVPQQEHYTGFLLDLANHQVETYEVKTLPPSIQGASFSQASGKLYVVTQDKIFNWQAGKGVQEEGRCQGCSALTEQGGVLYALKDGALYPLDKKPSANGKVTILGYTSPYDFQFTAQTGIEVEASPRTSINMMDDISRIYVTRDENVDIFSLFTDEGLLFIKEKGMYADLGASAELMQNKQHLYRGIQSHLNSRDSALMAWPVHIETYLFGAEEPVLKKLGFNTPQTFEQLLDLLPKLSASGIMEDQQLRIFDILDYSKNSLIPYFIQQYLAQSTVTGKAPDFNAPIFRRILSRMLKELPDQDPYASETGEELPVFAVTSIFLTVNENMRSSLKIAEGDPPWVSARLMVLVVNPWSKNKENALRYISYLSSLRTAASYNLYESMQDAWLNPAVAEEIKQTQDQKKNLEEQMKSGGIPEQQAEIERLDIKLKQLELTGYLVTPKAIDIYHSLMKNVYISEYTDVQYNEEMQKMVDRLIAGNMQVDQFIAMLNERLSLITTESK